MVSMFEDDFETIIGSLSVMGWDAEAHGGVPMDIDHPAELNI